MTKLESGDLWHKLSRSFRNKYHNGQFVARFRFGFDFNRLSTSERRQYIMVYSATMVARGIERSFDHYEMELSKC